MPSTDRETAADRPLENKPTADEKAPLPSGTSSPLGQTRTDAKATDPNAARADDTKDRHTGSGVHAVPLDAALVDFDARYRVLSELARGGMGRVLIAEDRALGRKVAVKEMLAPERTAAVLRFEIEARLSARLQHPGIVSVHDFARGRGGETYLVMRHVQGSSLTATLQSASTLKQRLRLLPAFIAACDAVAYAHQEGVVHRDLKPDNVLVGEFGDTVVIDWGIAKDLRSQLVSADSSSSEPQEMLEVTVSQSGQALTAVGTAIGTPGFMSPEQGRGEPADERSDVFALGAILYTLLAGKTPFRGTTQAVMTDVAEGRAEPLARRVPEVPPELVTVVERAMAVSKGARYANAGAMAADLKDFQAGRLVQSHSYSLGQLVRRWVRRNALAVSLSGAFVVALAIVGGVAIRRIIAERDRANREASVAQQVSDFMTGMFKVSDPSEARGNSITAREILDKGAKQIEGKLGDEPLVRSRLLRTMGGVYTNLGLYKQSRPLLEEALASAKAAGATPRELLPSSNALCRLGAQDSNVKQLPATEQMCREALALNERELGPDSEGALKAKRDLARVIGMEGRAKEEIELIRGVYETRRKKDGPENKKTLGVALDLEDALVSARRWDEARTFGDETLEIANRTLGPDDPITFDALGYLGTVAMQTGDGKRAEEIARKVFEARSRVFGPDHPDTHLAKFDLALAIATQVSALPPSDIEGRQALRRRAADLLREVVTALLRLAGSNHPNTLVAKQSLANQLVYLHEDAEASALMDDIEKGVQPLADANDQLMIVSALRAKLAAEKGDATRAHELLADAIKRGLSKADVEETLNESFFDSLRDRPEFKSLLASVQAKAK